MSGDLFPAVTPIMSRAFSMPNAETFSMRPVVHFIERWRSCPGESVDPFARNKRLASYTNDLDPATCADSHLEAGAFLAQLGAQGIRVHLAYFDPPYSPRQIAECYKNIGLKVGMAETQNAALYRRVRDAIDAIMEPGGIVLSFGWNSNGMGIGRRYTVEEILLVNHGGAHNDTICLAERKRP